MSRGSLINKSENIRDVIASALQQGGSVTITVDDNGDTITISGTDNDTTYTAGTGITLNGTQIVNASPDQTVELIEGSNVTITGTYPTFTITSTDTDTVVPAATNSQITTGTDTTQRTISPAQAKLAAETHSPAGQQSDWNQTNSSAIDFIENKPTLGSAADKDVGTGTGDVILGNDARLSDSRTCNNSFDNPATAKTNLSLNNVNNTSDANKPVSTAQQTALDAKIAIASIVDNLTTTTANVPLSANQGKILKDAIDNINTLLTSDEASLDTLQEIVDFIETNKATLDALGISNISGLSTALNAKVATTDVKNDLTSTDTDKPLSAAQGKALKDSVDSKVATTDVKDNLTSTDTDKPLSAAQGKALQDSKQPNLTHGIADTNTVKIDSSDVAENELAQFTASGLKSLTAAEMRSVLNVADGANNYTHPTGAGNKHIPSGGSTGQILRYSADGTAVWDNEATVSVTTANVEAAGALMDSEVGNLSGIKTATLPDDTTITTYTKELLGATTAATAREKLGFASSGVIRQVLFVSKNKVMNLSSTTWTDLVYVENSNTYALPGTISITPASASSKLMLEYCTNIDANGKGAGFRFVLTHGGTDYYFPTASSVGSINAYTSDGAVLVANGFYPEEVSNIISGYSSGAITIKMQVAGFLGGCTVGSNNTPTSMRVWEII